MNWKSILGYVGQIIPVIVFVSGLAFWVDGRHYHTEEAIKRQKITDIRYVSLQITTIEGHIRDYNRLNNPKSEDDTYYSLDIEQLINLKEERNKWEKEEVDEDE